MRDFGVKTPGVHGEAVAMEYAMVLVKDTQMPLKEVTLNAGFLEQGNFTRTFKNH